jgi:hypothetical protein
VHGDRLGVVVDGDVDVAAVLRQHFVHAGGGTAAPGEVVDADLVVVEGEAKLGRALHLRPALCPR